MPAIKRPARDVYRSCVRSVDELRRPWDVLLDASNDVASNLVVKPMRPTTPINNATNASIRPNSNTAYLEQFANQLEMQLQRDRAWLQFRKPPPPHQWGDSRADCFRRVPANCGPQGVRPDPTLMLPPPRSLSSTRGCVGVPSARAYSPVGRVQQSQFLFVGRDSEDGSWPRDNG
jgi:hypothetical protein